MCTSVKYSNIWNFHKIFKGNVRRLNENKDLGISHIFEKSRPENVLVPSLNDSVPILCRVTMKLTFSLF